MAGIPAETCWWEYRGILKYILLIIYVFLDLIKVRKTGHIKIIQEYYLNFFHAIRGRKEQDCMELLAALVLRVGFWTFNVIIFSTTYMFWGTAVARCLRCFATNRKVAVSIPAGVIGIFHWHKILPIALWPWGRLSL